MEPIVHQFPQYRESEKHHGHDEHAHEHHKPDFWSGYVFSTDHKIIGIQYGFTALCFLLFGFFLMLMMRWQIAHPGTPSQLSGRYWRKYWDNRRQTGSSRPTFTILSARCMEQSWFFWESSHSRSRRSAIT
jgi:hypothetical protein